MDKDERRTLRWPMKARSFLTVIAGVLLALLLLALALLWGMDRRSPLRLASQPLELPRAARFVPREADLSLHWLADPVRLPAYVQAVSQPSERRASRDAARRWRDGVFALAGLDFDRELAAWLGPELSLTLIDPGDSGGSPGWVLALTSRDSDGARRFLQRFWQTRSLAGTDLQVSRYRGMGLISGRGALLGREPQPLATALIDDDLLLLASGRGVLETALDVSQLQDQHQLGDARLQQELSALGDGVALLTASPRALQNWLQLPPVLAERGDLTGLVAALRPQGTDLAVEARLRFRDRWEMPPWAPLQDLASDAGGRAAWLASLQDPARLLAFDDSHPFSQWFGPLLRTQLSNQSALESIIGRDDGPLLWLQQEAGWLLASRSGHPDLDAVNADLEADGLARSQLAGDGEKLQVWTRLVRQRGNGDGLQAQLAVAMAQEAGRHWWGETLEALQGRQDHRGLQPRLQQWQQLKLDHAPTQVLLLDSDPAQRLMARWRPWITLQALAGQPLQSRVRGLVLAAESAGQDEQEPVLPLHARLELG